MRCFFTVALVSLFVISLQGQSWAQYEPLNDQTRRVLGDWVGYDSSGDLYEITNTENADGSVTGTTTITEVTSSGFRNEVVQVFVFYVAVESDDHFILESTYQEMAIEAFFYSDQGVRLEFPFGSTAILTRFSGTETSPDPEGPSDGRLATPEEQALLITLEGSWQSSETDMLGSMLMTFEIVDLATGRLTNSVIIGPDADIVELEVTDSGPDSLVLSEVGSASSPPSLRFISTNEIEIGDQFGFQITMTRVVEPEPTSFRTHP